MSNFISSDNLIETAKKQGVDFGKGDPYNRLRYYTKVGWLPHMIRKKGEENSVKGHYPAWALKRLILIENLKTKGLSNDEINSKIQSVNKWDEIAGLLNIKDLKTRFIVYGVLVLLIITLVSESGLLPIGKDKSEYIRNIVSSTK